jgi:hypothetical protein
MKFARSGHWLGAGRIWQYQNLKKTAPNVEESFDGRKTKRCDLKRKRGKIGILPNFCHQQGVKLNGQQQCLIEIRRLLLDLAESVRLGMEGSNMKGPKQLIIVIKLGEIPFLNTARTCLTIPGTSSIVDEVTHQPFLSVLSMIVETAIKLLKDGHRVIIVSSGAIGVGLRRMDIAKKPPLLPKVQVWPCVPLIFPSARPNGDDRHLPQ